ncbi:hypothetical protein ABF176_002447 [Flavobacterium psychrophilum]
MAINKISKNTKIIVKENYNLIMGGKLLKITNQFNVESTHENLKLISNKKITSDGNKH